MSDVMLFGVLRMPYEMAMGNELSRFQFWQRAQEAADRLEAAERTPAEQPAPASTGRDMLPVGTLAWALIAPNGNIRTWSYSRTNVDRVHAYAPECTVVPVIGARPVQATPVAARDLDVEAELLAAADAVVARWDSPKWKDEAPTADYIARLRRAIAAARNAAQGTQPKSASVSTEQAGDAWQVVPRVITDDMHIAFAEVWFSKVRPIDDHDMQDAYAAMLEAAPSPNNSPVGGKD